MEKMEGDEIDKEREESRRTDAADFGSPQRTSYDVVSPCPIVICKLT